MKQQYDENDNNFNLIIVPVQKQNTLPFAFE
jgi:hypothetical protein